MMRAMRWACAIGVLATVVGGASRAGAQATRTWVSGVGDDANPCSRTAPCRTFAGAISKTAGGGIQIALSSGTAQATIEGTHTDDNLFGVHVKGNALATVHDSSASGNGGAGFWAETAPAELNVDGSVAANNQTGIRATDSALVRLTAVTVSGNSADGLLAETSGQIVPFTSNLIAGNPTPAGAPVCEIDAGTTTVP